MEPNSRSWSRSWARDDSSRAARSAVFRENSKWWTKIHTRLTCVSGEEGHSTFLLAHYTFWFLFRTLATLVTLQNCTKCLEILHLIYKLHILASDPKKSFCSFSSNFWATFVTKSNFCLFFEQLFEKLREAFWKISSSFWKA